MRILYFINGLSYKGGMARIVVDKANYLSDVLGHEVTICTYNGKVESAFKLSNNLIIRTIKSGGGRECNHNEEVGLYRKGY